MRRTINAAAMAAAVLSMIFALALLNGCNEEEAPVTSTTKVTEPASSIDFNRTDNLPSRHITPRAKTAIDCPTNRYCGPMDVVFVIDVTGSMSYAIDNVKADCAGILDCIDEVSGGDYQLGLVTFNDDVYVVHNLASGNKSTIATSIAGLTASGGWDEPEASDEAIHTVVEELPARPNQTNNFDGWRDGAKKVVILVTDARPGGFNDAYDAGTDNVNANEWADEAAANDISISAIYTETWTAYSSTIIPIMQYYANTTGGVYHMTPSDGSGTGAAMLGIISTCGFAEIPIYIDIMAGGCPNPINTKSNGITPVAILGSATFSVTDINLSSVRLNYSVAPQNWSALGDVGTPFLGTLVDCYSCNSLGPDGFNDLKLKFSTPEIVASLGTVSSGDCIVLELTGELTSGTKFRGADIIKIVP